MNEQTPRDPETTPGANTPSEPAAAHDPAPRNPVAQPGETAATEQVAAAEAQPAKRGRGILRPVLIGSGAALTILAVAGIGMTIADAVGDGDDDPSRGDVAATAPAPTGDAASPGATDAPDDSAAPGTTPAPSGEDRPGGTAGSDEPADLVAAIDAAIAAAGGGEATSIEVERDGWDVDVRLPDGTEVDVRVLADGEPVVRADDDGDDTSNDPALDPSRIADIRDAAIAAAGGGSLVSIETDDEGGLRYEVEVAMGDDDVDVELADDLSVIEVG